MRLTLISLPSTMIVMTAILGAEAQPVCKSFALSRSVLSANIDHDLTDPVLKRGWKVIIDCRHPDWPPRVIEVGPALEALKTATRGTGDSPVVAIVSTPLALAPVIKVGSKVELWSETPVRLHLSGIALDTAGIGQRIHVRVRISGKRLDGVVRGPQSVQLMPDTSARREP